MKLNFKSSKLTVSLFSIIILYSNLASASTNDDLQVTEKKIQNNRQSWFNHLSQFVITAPPVADSKIAEWDRVLSNQYQAITGNRLTLANADKSQDKGYVYYSFMDKILGDYSRHIDLRSTSSFAKLESFYKTATYAFDDQASRIRSLDFILKDRFQRGRPYQVLDINGNYRPNYTNIKGSSYPSGHTWNGYKQAATLAILFPEMGGQIFARAIEYGESRVIVGAHFATDTIASRIGNYFSLAQLLADEDITHTFVSLAKETRQEIATLCHLNVRECIQQQSQATPIDNSIGYYGKTDLTLPSLITPQEIPNTAAYLLRLRFPYLTEPQWQSILASTAYPSNSLAGWNAKEGDPDSYWGLINLPGAYDGPAYFYENFIVNQDPNNNAFDIAGFTAWDEWKNDIHGPGKLIKNGEGILSLTGHNQFGGIDINEGKVLLAGENEFSELSTINYNGTLIINGTLKSALDVNGGIVELVEGKVNSTINVNNNGLISGNGMVNTLHLNNGSTIAPGYSIGKMTVLESLTFNPNSTYLVEISSSGSSDMILSQGTTLLNGGTVKVYLENSKNLLSEKQVHSLLGSQYNILNATNGITGEFDSVLPNYLFVGAFVNYTPNNVILNINRNSTAFSSVTQTANQHEVAVAVDKLMQGNAIYESIIKMSSATDARQAFDSLSGQIHADIASNQINISRHVRDALNERLRLVESISDLQKITNNNDGVWAKLLGDWEHASGDGNAFGYNASTYGVLFGIDTTLENSRWHLGIASGYTRSSLSGFHANADSDNFHVAFYAGKQLGAFGLRGGIAHTLHRIDTKRNVNYGVQFDSNHAKYNANTQQVFTEVGYQMTPDWMNLEPFVNLAYVRFNERGLSENGGMAALASDKQHLDATISTVGLRTQNTWKLAELTHITVHGELGWLHQYGSLEKDNTMYFKDTNSAFTINSVSSSRDGATIKLSTDVSLSKTSSISISYHSFLSKNHNDNSVYAKFSLDF